MVKTDYKVLFKDYYVLTKPGIIRGNLLTGTAGFLLAAQGHVSYGLLLTFLTGMSLIIASACVCNNVIDRHIDKRMKRTRSRALVTGMISPKQALSYAAALGTAGVLIMLLRVNLPTAAIGIAAFLAYVVLYGIGKRRTTWGTLIGCISGAAPPVGGYAAAVNRLDGASLLLFLIMVSWQMPHFYAIAMYRFKDYSAAGLPVLPVVKGFATAKVRIILYITAFLVLSLLLTEFGYAGHLYTVVTVCIGLLWFGLALRGLHSTDDTRWARSMFLISLIVITGWCAAIGVDAALG